MELFWYIIVFVFGAIIGSFLNVVIYRMHTGKSINGRSHCMTCGTHLAWYELFPIFSYIALHAKCRTCSAFIPSRYIIVELLTGGMFVLLWYLMKADVVQFFVYAGLIATLIVILVYDIRHTIIPDELAITIGGIAIIILGYSYYTSPDTLRVLYDVLAALCTSGFFAGLWLVSKGKWIGLGDAKLALPLALIVGHTSVFTLVVLSFWIGAVISITILTLQKVLERWKTHLPYLHETITMKSEVPFAPFLITGFLLVKLFHADIFVIISNILPF